MMSRPNKRYIEGRVNEAVSALQGARAEFEKTLNASFDFSSTDELNQSSLSERKRPKTEETAEDKIRAIKDELLQCQTKVVAIETDKEMQLSLYQQDALEKDDQLRRFKIQLEDAIKAKESAINTQREVEENFEKKKSSLLSNQGHLQREIQLLHQRVDDLETKRSELTSALETERSSHMTKRTAEQKEAFEVQKQLIEARAGWNEAAEKNRLLEDSQKNKDCRIEQLSNEVSRLTDELSQLKTTIQENQWASKVLENFKDLEDKMKVMAQWETEIIQLRKDNEKLREDRSNVSLMREKLCVLENIKQTAERARERAAELECELQVTRRLCQEWEQSFVQIDETLDSPESVLRQLRKLQSSEICLLEENNKLKTELALLTNGQRLENREAETIKRLQRKLRLVAKERDSYRGVLDSYENDVTINPVSIQSKRVATLESFIDDYRKLVNELEIDGCKRAKEFASVEVQTDTSGEDNQDNGLRLIHFKVNPLDVAHQERIVQLGEIQKENDILRAKVKALEARGPSDQSVPDVSLSDLIKDDPRKLRVELEAAKKRQERIMAAFKKTSKEFRQAVYCLSGYRIDMTSNRCVLRHVYAEHPDDQLEFEVAENGFLQLLSNDYSLKLEQLTTTYLQKMDSIPAFLSALTLQLFNSQTMMQMEQPSMFVSD